MRINIKGENAKLTPEAHSFINKKIGSLEKYFDNIIEADVEVGLTSFHHKKGNIYRAEGNLQVPGKILRATEETDNIVKAINKVRSKLKRELIKYKRKLFDKR